MSIQSSASARDQTRSRGRRLIAILSVIAVLCATAILSTGVSPAWAKDYPSWSDVIAARANQSASQAKVTEIQGLLAQLANELAAAEADAAKKGEAYQLAEEAYFEATVEAEELQADADAAAALASESQTRAGQLAAQIARTGGNDLTINILMNGDSASNLLATMGQAGKISEQANKIYEQAIQDKNTSQALTDKADVAKKVLEQLKVEAQTAFEEAQAATEAAAAALAASETHRVELEAQLAALTSATVQTEADYKAGVEAERQRVIAAKAAADAKAARDAAAAQAAAAAARPASSGGGGSSSGGGGATYTGGGSTTAGQPAASGWANPGTGNITSGYGYRIHPVYGTSRLHSGTDIAGGCGIPIYAAHSGTVAYAGVYGTYGNWVLINNGDGVSTGYAHIVNGGIRVSVGQTVTAGQVIAYVGSTGASTGCHLHYEVRINGVATNAVPYMANVGITLG
jgi:murein DD-endopeptidase MepM/ murein hydrolase activator NlpD